MNRMSPFTRNTRVSNTHTHRTGATLVEVLMALLIMAVGVTSVFTLFPISIIKAIKANQLTNAKLYEGAIKDTLLTHPQLWTGAPAWSENTVYGQTATNATIQDRWVTPKTNGRLLPDTNQLFFHGLLASGVSGTRQPAEFDGRLARHDWFADLSLGGYQNFYNPPSTPSPPLWYQTASGYQPAHDGGLRWNPYRHSPYLANPLWSAYMVDPLGWYRVAAPADQVQFGRLGPTDTTGTVDSSGTTAYLDRIHAQISSDSADGVFRLQDSWSEVLEATEVIVTTPTATTVQIEFPPKLAETVFDSSLSPLHRVVLLSTLNSRVVVLPVLSPVNTPASSSILRINGTLPAGFVPADFDQARIEIQSPSRYSWLMSVHSGPRGEFNAECAIVFNRSFETLDEQGYRAEFCVTEDLNGDGDAADPGEDGMLPNGRPDSNIAKVRWPYNPNTDPPRIKEGGYIFDASFGYWYKIQKIEVNEERVDAADVPDSAGAYVRTIMTLSDQVKVSSRTAGNANPFTDYQINGTVDAQAVLMPGVVHVFTPETPQ